MQEVTGGAQVTEVEIEPVAKDLAEDKDTVRVITTAKGTFGVGGIAQIGTEAVIKVEAFSVNWMRPKHIGDRNKLVAAGKLPKPAPKPKESA